LTVNVASDAPSSVTNTATVSGGGDLNPANNTAVDRLAVGTFTDVPPDHPFFSWIDGLFRAGITGGCSPSPPQYCPDFESTRAQMAVFLLRGIHGRGYSPPAATGTMFDDVPASHPLASWIEELAREGITAGCSTSPPRYCPDARVTRAEMAVFLLRSIHGSGYAPPAATGMFADVPASNPFAPWIEQLTREGITTGCSTSPPRYCPDAAVTRGQMAVFLDRAFHLPVPSFRPVVAYVANSGGKNVSVVDTSNDAVVATIGVGRNPAAVAVNPSGTRVYVANWGGASVSVIDTSTNLVVATIGAGSEPRGLAVNPAGTRLYVANSVFDGTLLVIDTSTHAVVATVPVEVAPVGVAANPAGTRVYVVNSGFSNSVSVIDTSTNAVIATVGVGQDTLPRNVAVHPAGSRVYVVNTLGNSVSVIDTSTNTVVATVPVGPTPDGVAVHPDGTRVYVANLTGQTVTVIETAGNTVATTIPVGGGSTGVAVHPDGTRLYVTISGAVAVIDTATNTVVGSVPVGNSPAGVAVTSIPSH
jgi:YVTN family beta-propeller protein